MGKLIPGLLHALLSKATKEELILGFGILSMSRCARKRNRYKDDR
jgi:hypothetical protein